MDDWRLQGQENYLQGARLIFKAYKKPSDSWDHDHCDFCGAEFSETGNHLREGYCTKDERAWICPECFEDFKQRFEWIVEAD